MTPQSQGMLRVTSLQEAHVPIHQLHESTHERKKTQKMKKKDKSLECVHILNVDEEFIEESPYFPAHLTFFVFLFLGVFSLFSYVCFPIFRDLRDLFPK